VSEGYEGGEGSEYPDYVLEYFERRGLNPDDLKKYPHTRTFFMHVSRDGIQVLDEIGDAIEKDPPHDDDAAAHDPELAKYLYVIH
jgi:hypothetical protein